MRGRSVVDLAAVAAVVILLGGVAGAVWAAITPTVTGEVIGPDRARIPPEQVPEEFAGVGSFSIVMLIFGVVAALVVWFAARTWRGVVGFVAAIVSVGIASGIAMIVGSWIVDLTYQSPAETPVGQTFHLVGDLWLEGMTRSGPATPWILLICAPFSFTLGYLICVLSSRTADLGVGDLDDEPAEPMEHFDRSVATA